MPYNPNLVRIPLESTPPGGVALSYRVLTWLVGITAALVFAYLTF